MARSATAAGVVRFDTRKAPVPLPPRKLGASPRAGPSLLDRGDGERGYRMRVSPAGDDPRVALREQAELSDDERRALDARLDRWDASGTCAG